MFDCVSVKFSRAEGDIVCQKHSIKS